MFNTEIKEMLIEAERHGLAKTNKYSKESLVEMLSMGLIIERHPHWVLTALGKFHASTLCPKCYAEMSLGKALIERLNGCYDEERPPVKYTDCKKCHSCGYSETIH